MADFKYYLEKFLGKKDTKNGKKKISDQGGFQELFTEKPVVSEPKKPEADTKESVEVESGQEEQKEGLFKSLNSKSEEPEQKAEIEVKIEEPSEVSEFENGLILEKTDVNNQIIEAKPRKKFFAKREKSVNDISDDENSSYVTVHKWTLLISAIILIVVCVLTSFFVANKLFFGGYFIDKSNKVSFNLEGTDNYTLAKLQSVITAVENDFYPGVDKNVIAEGAISGIVEALGDQYTVYYKPGTMDAYQEIINGEYQGMGAVVKSNAKGLEITTVYEGGPAASAGLVAGDIVISVNDQSAVGMDGATVRELFGTGGKELSLKVLDSKGTEKTVTLKIDTVKVQTVYSKSEGKGIYRIVITQFDSDTGDEFYQELTKIMGEGCRALILDLRNNGGGYESEAVKVADMILPEGVIATSKNKQGEVIKEILSEESQLEMPVTVLVNGNTASASELLAGAIKDFGKGKIVGSKTYGKAIGQVQLAFEKDGSGLVITTACYYTPSGNCIQGEGIVPDVEAELAEDQKNTPVKDIPSDKDAPLQKALEVITAELE